ncbi:hypothetical protein NQ317_010868 [Molorchus minor]|uniref:Death domain-containing protein n=1 Tax=Molorchus minor TaxID=1323400 RepID=A0ABQ9JYZ2_9CUCU|nr:hypothetical protein NQ317_010868 [Molorchus minor]
MSSPKNNNDLTTDACPSPPRDNKDSCQSSEEEIDNKEGQNGERIGRNGRPSYTKNTKPRGFTKARRISPATVTPRIFMLEQKSFIILMERAKQSQKKDIIETKAIKSLRESRDPLTREDLLFVATHMDENWQDVARILNYSDGQIQQFNIDHRHYGMKEVIYQFLLDWTQNEPAEATVGTLCNLLWDHNQKDSVKRWSEKY